MDNHEIKSVPDLMSLTTSTAKAKYLVGVGRNYDKDYAFFEHAHNGFWLSELPSIDKCSSLLTFRGRECLGSHVAFQMLSICFASLHYQCTSHC